MAVSEKLVMYPTDQAISEKNFSSLLFLRLFLSFISKNDFKKIKIENIKVVFLLKNVQKDI